jgi:hypothetical protein
MKPPNINIAEQFERELDLFMRRLPPSEQARIQWWKERIQSAARQERMEFPKMPEPVAAAREPAQLAAV